MKVLIMLAIYLGTVFESDNNKYGIVQKLYNSYEILDHDAFMEAFPREEKLFSEIYGLEGDNIQYPIKGLIEEFVFKHLDFFFSNKKLVIDKYLDVLLSLSVGFSWDEYAHEYFAMGCNQLLHGFPKEITEFLSDKTDDEVVSFLRLCILTGFPTYDGYIEDYKKLSKEYALYSERIAALLKVARLEVLNDPNAYEYLLFGPNGAPEAPKDEAMPE